jgi:hypothetical protein
MKIVWEIYGPAELTVQKAAALCRAGLELDMRDGNIFAMMEVGNLMEEEAEQCSTKPANTAKAT